MLINLIDYLTNSGVDEIYLPNKTNYQLDTCSSQVYTINNAI